MSETSENKKYALLPSVQTTLPEQSELQTTDILIDTQSGLIEAIGENLLETKNLSTENIHTHENCRGKIAMPGFIDPHVHFRYPGMAEAEDWATGSAAAIFGGVTTILEMPNNNPAITDSKTAEIKLAHVRENSRINYGIFGGFTGKNLSELIENPDFKALKIYMGSSTGDLLVENLESLQGAKTEKVFVFHAEKESIIKAGEAQYGPLTSADLHSKIRSEEAAIEATQELLELHKKVDLKFHIAHLSTAAEIEMLYGSKISYEVAPHHIYCNTDLYQTGGFLWKVNPPLRSPETAAAIQRALYEGKINMIATDHAPHPIEAKTRKEPTPASGLPSVQVGTHFILNDAANGKFSFNHAAEILATSAAKRFEIERRGELREGYFADIAVVDPNHAWTMQNELVLSGCGWTPFAGQNFGARVIATFVNGFAYDNLAQKTPGKRGMISQV